MTGPDGNATTRPRTGATAGERAPDDVTTGRPVPEGGPAGGPVARTAAADGPLPDGAAVSGPVSDGAAGRRSPADGLVGVPLSGVASVRGPVSDGVTMGRPVPEGGPAGGPVARTAAADGPLPGGTAVSGPALDDAPVAGGAPAMPGGPRIGVVAVTASGRTAAATLAAAWPEKVRIVVADGVPGALRAAWRTCDAVVAFLAVGATVRVLAPLLGDKTGDPAVVCVDESLSFAVAVLGGHHGANALAHRVSGVLGCRPVVTTASDQGNVTPLDSYGADLGFTVPDRTPLASVGAAVLSGEPVLIEGAGHWPLPPLPPNVSPDAAGARHRILVTDAVAARGGRASAADDGSAKKTTGRARHEPGAGDGGTSAAEPSTAESAAGGTVAESGAGRTAVDEPAVAGEAEGLGGGDVRSGGSAAESGVGRAAVDGPALAGAEVERLGGRDVRSGGSAAESGAGRAAVDEPAVAGEAEGLGGGDVRSGNGDAHRDGVLVYRPPSLVVGVGSARGVSAAEVGGLIDEALAAAGLAPESVRCVATAEVKAAEEGILRAAAARGWQVVTHPAADLAAVAVPNPSDVVRAEVGTPSVAEAAALLTARRAGRDAALVVAKRKSANATVAVARLTPRGRLSIVGLGPGARDLLTPRAAAALRRASVVVGLDQYLDQVRDLLRPGTRVLASGLGREEERARTAVAEAAAGRAVALVGSGDAGVYAMASPALEFADADIDVDGVPGITAAVAASALLGAPLGHDHAYVSLSDLHTPWEVIERRVTAAAEGDFTVCLYNPRSRARAWQLPKALAILAAHRPPETPVGYVRNATRPDETVTLTTLAAFDPAAADMFTVVIVGSSRSRAVAGRFVTPRGYRWA